MLLHDANLIHQLIIITIIIMGAFEIEADRGRSRWQQQQRSFHSLVRD